MNRFYVCKRIRLLEHLQKNGFTFLKQQPDRNNKNFSVWIFKDSIPLREAVESYYNSEQFIKDKLKREDSL